MVLPAKVAFTPAGKLAGTPMPVAPVVACVMLVSAILIHSVGVDEAAVTVLAAVTVMVIPVLLLTHPDALIVTVKVAL